MSSFPFISVIIANYNGEHYLPACLDALRTQSYPSDRFEVIVSDNGSKDGSLELLRTRYPWVRVIANERNLGFALGNNVAIRASRGEYVVLLNNDTAPLPTWLENLVAVAESDPRVGMVTARIQLFYDQLVLTLQSAAFTSNHDGRVLGAQIFGVDGGAPGGVVQYLNGFYGWEHLPCGRRFRWMGDQAHLGVPVPPGAQDWYLSLILAAPRPQNQQVWFTVAIGDRLLAEFYLSGATPVEHQVRIPADARALAMPLVQNTGSLVFQDGSGRDRGTFVRDFEVFYEEDNGQYGSVEEVAAGCGASLLIRRTMLEDVGLLDEDFFMYYEDTDLSLRARWRGWRILYAPQAIVRHIHCGSSQEWSPLFVYYTDRNRLAMLFKHGAPRQIWRAWGTYVAGVFSSLLKTVCALLRGHRDWRGHVRQALIQWRVVGALLYWLPTLWRKRRRIQKSARVSFAEIWSEG